MILVFILYLRNIYNLVFFCLYYIRVALQTGTLTEEDLDLAGVMQSSGGDFKQPREDLTHLPPGEPLTKALATCHSLAIIDGKLKGSPLDVKIFTGIAWVW